MLLAESMYDPSVALNLECRLNPTLRKTLSDNTIFPYFLQFMESLGKFSRNLIRFWIQTECLIISQTNFEANDRLSTNFKHQFINDSIGLFNKYLSEGSINSIDVPQDMRSQIKSRLSIEKCQSLPDSFRSVQNYVIELIEGQYYDSFMKSSYYFKYEIDLLSSGSVTLADILFNNSSLAINFIEFMESEGMKSYVDFLIMFENYRKVSNNYDDAIALFNRFFECDNTTNKLGFSENLISSLSEKLVKNNFSSDCMDRAAAVLIQYFEKTYLKQFIESQLFVDYLNNCFQAIQNNAIQSDKSHKRTNSDSSYNSDASHASTCGHSDTSLASSLAASHKQRRSRMSGNIIGDPLWRRDLSGNLQITHIDQYGRISSELEPEPDHKGLSPLSKVMQKLSLNSTSDKENEEIAWKIATMIVNDVNTACNRSVATNSQSSHNYSWPDCRPTLPLDINIF